LGFVPHLLEPLVRKSFAFHWINAKGSPAMLNPPSD
jgi:hypothetical protein